MSSFVNLLIERNFLAAVGIFLAAIISIILHEISHGLAALWNGDRTAKHNGRLTLNPIKHFDPAGFLMFALVGFGWAKPVPVDPRNFRKHKTGLFTVAIAGVTMNLILAFFSCPLVMIFAESSKMFIEFLYYFFLGMFSINLMLFVFNLIPIYPLDGFRVIESIFPSGNRYTRFMYKYGAYILLCVLVIIWALSYFWIDILGEAVKWIGWPIERLWGLVL